MNTYRKVQFKSTLFDGYYVWMDVKNYKNTEQLIQDAKQHLINFLRTFNLIYLEQNAKNLIIKSEINHNDALYKMTVEDTIYLYESSI